MTEAFTSENVSFDMHALLKVNTHPCSFEQTKLNNEVSACPSFMKCMLL